MFVLYGPACHCTHNPPSVTLEYLPELIRKELV